MAFPRVILSSAQLEYEAIVEYLAVDLASPTAAERFMAEFSYQLDLVCDMPEIHALSRMPELAALGFRPMLANGYVALYPSTARRSSSRTSSTRRRIMRGSSSPSGLCGAHFGFARLSGSSRMALVPI